MTHTLDPIQGLIDYVEEIKPFHTKVLEVAVTYSQSDDIDVTFTEGFTVDITLLYPALADDDDVPIRNCPEGYGIVWDRPTPYIVISAGLSPQTICLDGDQSVFFTFGSRFEIREPPAQGVTTPAGTTPLCVSFDTGTDVADTTRVMTSTDGTDWTLRTTPDELIADAVFNPDDTLFVAVGTNVLWTSSDGITWISQTAHNANAWTSVAWSNPTLGRYAMVSGNSAGGNVQSAYSTDGINWIDSSLAIGVGPGSPGQTPQGWSDLIWVENESLFVAVGARPGAAGTSDFRPQASLGRGPTGGRIA